MPPNSNPHLYGYSFLFNTQTNDNMGLDGYDNYQAPLKLDGSQVYWRRMWAGGQFDYIAATPALDLTIDCVEQISSIRTLNNNTFVQIERNFAASQIPFLTELRTLAYTDEPFNPAEQPSTLRNHLVNDFDRWAVTKFTLRDIMRYNFLTYNLHKIHYDRDYCISEGFEDIIVSGPFMVLVLLHYFAGQFPNVSIKSFKYRNIWPCYIDREVRLGIRVNGASYNLELQNAAQVLWSGRIKT